MEKRRSNITRMVLSAMFLALGQILPLITGGIPQIGNMLCPMHIPTLLCGFFCGPYWAMAVGALSPILRMLFFGIPPLIPKGLAMTFELATYGLVTGLMYRALPKKKINVYISLLTAMIAGRIVWGVVRVILYGVAKAEFSWALFISGAFTTAIPGIIIQIVLIPILVIALDRAYPELRK